MADYLNAHFDSLSLYEKALIFAAEAHKWQRRKDSCPVTGKSGSAYINHPVRVALAVKLIAKIDDVDTRVAALLHDTVEDTGVTFDQLVSEFGQRIANIVMEVTDDKSLSKVERKKLQIEHAGTISYEARLVKLADKLDNLHDLLNKLPTGWTNEVALGYFVWASFTVDQMIGTNELLEAELFDVLTKGFQKYGAEGISVFESSPEKLQLLENYYKLM